MVSQTACAHFLWRQKTEKEDRLKILDVDDTESTLTKYERYEESACDSDTESTLEDEAPILRTGHLPPRGSRAATETSCYTPVGVQ